MAVNLKTTLSAYKKVSITGDTDELEQRVSTLETEVTNLNKEVSDLSNDVAENTSNISTNTESISSLKTSVDTLEKKQDYDIESLTVNGSTSLYGDTLIADGLTVYGGCTIRGGIKQEKNFVNFTKSKKSDSQDNPTVSPSTLTIKKPCTILVTSTVRKLSKLTKDKWYGTKKGNSLEYTEIQLSTGEIDTLDLIKKMTGIDVWKRTTISEYLKDFTFTKTTEDDDTKIIFPETRNGDTEIFVLAEDMSTYHSYLIPEVLKKALKKIDVETESLFVPKGVPTEIKGKYTGKCMVKFIKDFKKGVFNTSWGWDGNMANLWLELQETAFKYNGSWNMVIRVIPHRFN